MNCRGFIWTFGLILACVSMVATAGLPPPKDLLLRAGFTQRLGAQAPMALTFKEANGRKVSLAQIASGKPVVIALGYYRCPNLCGLVLQGMAKSVSSLPLHVGQDYQVVFISIDPREKPADAMSSATMLQRMQPNANIQRWHLLTGDGDSIHHVADALGFAYFQDPRDQQFAHPAGLVVLTGTGKIAQYFFGLGFSPSSLRLALIDASRGRLGNVVDRLVLLCCGYDPTTGRYSLLTSRVMQGLGAGFVLFMLVLLYRLRLRGPE